jgi:hypothetical protein
LFLGAPYATVFYLPGSSGWSNRFAGSPALLWNPAALTGDNTFGVRNNCFGFTIAGTPDIPLVIEAATQLSGVGWTPLQTCILTNGSIYFTDPQWTDHPARFYRFRSP